MNKAPPKPFLKWAGGKHKLAAHIASLLPPGKVLLEPFVGGGSVFLATDYPKYVLNDVNPDLINLYKYIQSDVKGFLRSARRYISDKNNNERSYYRLRERFNKSRDAAERSVLFLYFNRAGYNGLVRYSTDESGEPKFNVPFGRYSTLRLPESEINYFSERSQYARFSCVDFRKAFKSARKNWVVYADPPYFPITATSSFTDYHSGGFSLEDQEALAGCALEAVGRGVSTLISNHDVPLARQLYRHAKLSFIDVQRTISANVSRRRSVQEVLALYTRKV